MYQGAFHNLYHALYKFGVSYYIGVYEYSYIGMK